MSINKIAVHRFRFDVNPEPLNLEPLPPAYRAYGPAGTVAK
jgi:hypothetical protein